MKLSVLKYYLFGGLVTILGISLFLYPICLFDIGSYVRPKESLALITSPLAISPEYIKKTGNSKSSGSNALRLNLQNYPGIYFDNGGVLLDATDYKSVLADIKLGDTVSVLVSKEELSKFGTPEIPQSISEQFAVPPYLEFYSLKFKDKEYVSDIARIANRHRKDLIIPFSIFGSIFIFFGLRYIILKR